MLMLIIGVIVALLVLLLLLAASKPDTFRVERTISIKGAPAQAAALINDFHHWAAWSPWEKLDPAMQRTFSGAAQGVGAIYEWTGNGKVGQGRMQIMETSPSRTLIKLDFIRPFAGHNTTEYTFEAKGEYTQVTWAMFGPCPFVSKIMQVFTSMDRMIGKDFEAGLNNIKAVVERA